jgi:TolB protein
MRAFLSGFSTLLFCSILSGQQPTTVIDVGSKGVGNQPALAVPDFRGTGAAQPLMDAFNATLFSELQNAGVFRMVAKTFYPLQVPQQPQDFKAPVAGNGRNSNIAVSQGPWVTDWSNPPVSASYLAFGYTTVTDGRLELFGWLYNLTVPVTGAGDIGNAQALGKRYLTSLDEAGARKVAQDFAADILAKFGFKGLGGSKIYYISNRSGNKEIWSMDYDGSNQKQFTNYRTISTTPAVSADGSKIAFTTYAKGSPTIFVHSTESGRKLVYYTQNASLSTTPEFTPDGTQILFSSTAGGGGYANLFASNVDGSGLRRLSTVRALEVEPKVNPKTGRDIVFVSGRSGPPQIYRMNIDGADIDRLTPGEGEAVNPSWSPDGTKIAFAWTRGFEPGNFNIFIMDVASRKVVQLTNGAGRNENPTWAPDGLHLVFSSNRGGSSQIWTMLADGTQLKQLTTQGRNEKPVWTK